MFFPLITHPTRITAHVASLIDNIFTNDPLSYSVNGLFLNDLSDHLPIFALFSGNCCVQSKDKYITFRDKSVRNMEKFKSELQILD